MVSALDRKLLRDLRRQSGQALTIALVIACGIAGYVSMRGCWISLERSRDRYFETYRFGDVFVHLDAAPRSVVRDLEKIAGVRSVEARLVEPIRVLGGASADPPRGYAISLPADATPRLDALWVRSGRPFDAGRRDEAVLLRSFGEAAGIAPGQRIEVVIEGRTRTLTVTGLADSPEFVFAAVPGELMPDPKRFAVLWMATDTLAPMIGGVGTFDDAVLALQPDASVQETLLAVDRILAPFGGSGAVARKDQPSARFLDQEMAQLRMLSLAVPIIFVAVAAFLLQILLARIVELQRTQIATLKAFGYERGEIARHFLGFALAIGLAGTGAGLALGAKFGREMVGLYAEFFRLPLFAFRLTGELVAVSLGAGVIGGVAGTIGTVLRIAAMPPAEAMQPAAPPAYTRGWIERAGLLAPLGPVARMAVRDLVRQPARLAFSVLGIASAAAVIVLGRFANDSIGEFMDALFDHAQAEDVTVVLTHPVHRADAASTLAALPGVASVETQRLVPTRFRVAHRSRDGALVGYGTAPRLRRLLAYPFREHPVPADGIVLTDALARLLGVRPGGTVDVEALFGRHARATLRVTDLLAEPVGLFGHVSLQTVGRILDEADLVDHAYLTVSDGPRAMAALAEVPGVLAATQKDVVRALFGSQTESTRRAFVGIATSFGCALAVGIVYNNARIALSRRARELASLRVLGFSRREVASIIGLELTVQVALGIPLGLWLGRAMATAILSTVSEEMWRFPIIVVSRTHAFAVAVVVASAACCFALVRRHVARLDLVGVLKTRE